MSWRDRASRDDDGFNEDDVDAQDVDGQDDDADWDGDGDADDSGDEPTVPCPYCRAEMFEDSPRCPSCGRFISAEDAPPPSKPLWVLVTALVCLAIAVWMAFASF